MNPQNCILFYFTILLSLWVQINADENLLSHLRAKRQGCVDYSRVPGTCNQFYRCAHGVSSVFTCGPGTVFNAALNICDWPANVNCNGASGGNAGCVDYSRVPGTCNQYNRCANGVSTVFTCGPGTVFNAALNVCDWPSNVNCNGGAIVTAAPTVAPTPAPTAAPSGDSRCPSINLTRVPGNCNQFYRCIDNQVVTVTCEAGSVFDDVVRGCNNPNSVSGACGSAGTGTCGLTLTAQDIAVLCPLQGFRASNPNCC